LPASRINKNPQTVLGKIQTAMRSNDFIFSLLLEHSALESYLSEMILKSYAQTDEVSKKSYETYRRINLNSLLSLTNILGMVNKDLYGQIKSFSQERNKLVHNLIGYDFSEADINNKISKLATQGLKLCEQVSKLYENILLSNYLDVISSTYDVLD
jgi:hypothetical protein